jgi:hypothetical protein
VADAVTPRRRSGWIPESQRNTVRLYVRLTPERAEAIRSLCEQTGYTLADVVELGVKAVLEAAAQRKAR